MGLIFTLLLSVSIMRRTEVRRGIRLIEVPGHGMPEIMSGSRRETLYITVFVSHMT
jgi:hypothetical protein